LLRFPRKTPGFWKIDFLGMALMLSVVGGELLATLSKILEEVGK